MDATQSALRHLYSVIFMGKSSLEKNRFPFVFSEGMMLPIVFSPESMALPPQKFRELVFQLIYSSDFTKEVEESLIPFMMRQLAISKKNVKEAVQRGKLVLEKISEIDVLIAGVSEEYQFDRITSVEKNILRLAVFELLFDETIPPKVAISEAIRLSRKFSTPEGAAFVNAILDGIYKKRICAL